ncbi:hypothetical protein C2W62_04790 [Candidatus Entotheonella serta]|nr:hypothetical protein C2W62_04790 [Candidatus Entotheonella serta]
MPSPRQKWLKSSPSSAQSIWRDKRDRQYGTIASEVNPYDISDEEKRINRYTPISIAALGLAIAGRTLYAPLSLLSLAGILYVTVPIYQYAYRALFIERRANVDVLYALTQTAVILNGSFIASGVGVVNFCISYKLLLRARERFQKNAIQVVKAMPRSVLIWADGLEVGKPFDEINLNDIVIIAAGEINQTQHSRTEPMLWAEQITNKTVVPMLALGGASLPFLGFWGAAAPLCTLHFLNLASERGILVKDGRAFERLSQVDAIVFDKTGTLTLERPSVSGIHTYHGFSEVEILAYAAAVEARQSHPIAHAIRLRVRRGSWLCPRSRPYSSTWAMVCRRSWMAATSTLAVLVLW